MRRIEAAEAEPRIARVTPENDPRQEEADQALSDIQELRKRTGRVTLQELLDGCDERRDC